MQNETETLSYRIGFRIGRFLFYALFCIVVFFAAGLLIAGLSAFLSTAVSEGVIKAGKRR